MGNYDDIIDLPHYEPRHHQRMSMMMRAAQFAPFAALTGREAYEDKKPSEKNTDQHEMDSPSADVARVTDFL